MGRILLLHPDLGVGGAERLVVDAALALKSGGHDVKFVTTHHDPNHCFMETKDGTIPVTVYGDWLPRHVYGRFFALCAYIRMIYAALCILFLEDIPDIVLCDLVSICIPILKLRCSCVIFYVHFPDQLLSNRGGLLKKIYRAPLNYLEEYTTGKADKIFVNSEFTQGVVKKTFKKLKIETEILYPTVHTEFFDKTKILPLERVIEAKLPKNSFIVLSINRYERKKDLHLCIEAMSILQTLLRKDFESIYLIMAGGYDKRVEENVEHYLELIGVADELHVSDHVIFLRSPSDQEKISLLHHADIVVYTPSNEHFGIVPLEAMYAGKPVIAQNSGGPKESIKNGQTGFLVDTDSSDFAGKMRLFVCDKKMKQQFGKDGKQRFNDLFSFDAFKSKLNSIVKNLLEDCEKRKTK